MLGISPLASVLVSAAVVALYVSMGGYKSIIKTDILQFIIILSIWGLLFFIPLNMKTMLDFSTIYTSSSPAQFWSAIMYGILLIFAYADFWQRIFSSKNDKVARKATRLIFPAWLLMSLPITFIGMSAKGIIPADTGLNEVFTAILESGAYPTMIIGFMTLIGISVTMSILDTYSYVFSSTLLENFLNIKNKKKYIYASKITMVILLFVSAILALTIESMLAYLFNSLSLMMVLSPLFLLVGSGIMKNKSKLLDTLFMLSIVISFLIGSYLFAQGSLNTFSMRLVAPAISTTLMIVSYIIVKVRKS